MHVHFVWEFCYIFISAFNLLDWIFFGFLHQEPQVESLVQKQVSYLEPLTSRFMELYLQLPSYSADPGSSLNVFQPPFTGKALF